MKLASLIKRSAPMSWQVVTPQLMGRAVSRLGTVPMAHAKIRSLALGHSSP